MNIQNHGLLAYDTLHASYMHHGQRQRYESYKLRKLIPQFMISTQSVRFKSIKFTSTMHIRFISKLLWRFGKSFVEYRQR